MTAKKAGSARRPPGDRKNDSPGSQQHDSTAKAAEPELTGAAETELTGAEPELTPADSTEPELTPADSTEPELTTAEPAEPELAAVELSEPEVPTARQAAHGVSEPSVPSDPRVTALLGEISEIRLSAATHLTIAAAAMDAGRPDIAAELIEAQQRDVARLRLRAEELLGVDGEVAEQARRSVAQAAAVEESTLLATARTPATKSLRRTPRSSDVAVLPRRAEVSRAPHWSATGAAVAIVVALLVAFVRPFAPHATSPDASQISASVVASLDANVSRSYNQLRETAKPKTPQMDVEQAQARLHADLQRLLPMAASDPDAARRVLDVLKAERQLLADHAPAALAAYLPEAARIVTQLRDLASPTVLAILPPVDAIVPQNAGSSDALPAAPKPAPDPVLPAATSGSGSTSGSSADSGSTDQPAAPAPVVQVPDVPQPPPAAPPAGDSGGGTTGSDAGSTGSGGQPPADGSGSSSVQLPLPQLPAPPVVNPVAN